MFGFKEFLTEERIDPATFDLPKLYRDLNKKYFSDSLPKKIRVEFSKIRSIGLASVDAPGGVINPNSYRIQIRPRTYTMESLIDTLLHEMIHIQLFTEGDLDHDHYGKFETYRKKLSALAGINISISHTADVDELPEVQGGVLLFQVSGTKSLLCSLYTTGTATAKAHEMQEFFLKHIELVMAGKKWPERSGDVFGTKRQIDPFCYANLFIGRYKNVGNMITTKRFDWFAPEVFFSNKYFVDSDWVNSIEVIKPLFTVGKRNG